MHVKRMVALALLVAVAGVLHVVESWIPVPIPVPGVKLGLANIVTLFAIVMYGWQSAAYVAVLRVLLGSLLGGALLGPAFAMSMAGALVSLVVMAYACRHWQSSFSLIGISLFGAVAHNMAQIALAALIVASPELFWYLPYLVLFAVPTGIATGCTAEYFLAKLPRAFGQ